MSLGDRTVYNYRPGRAGDFGAIETTGVQVSCAEDSSGVTIDSAGVATDVVGIAVFNFNPDRGTNAYPTRVRAEEGRQYKVRFHLTSTRPSNTQCQVRMRARSAKWAWTQKLELGGALAAGLANNTIAQEALPGIGCQNPDRYTTDTAGGWYTLIMHTPLSADIRPDFATGTPIETRMPALAAEPGPGVNSPSRRDILVGLDLLDSITGNENRPLEVGNFTLDRVEVRAQPLVVDY